MAVPCCYVAHCSISYTRLRSGIQSASRCLDPPAMVYAGARIGMSACKPIQAGSDRMPVAVLSVADSHRLAHAEGLGWWRSVASAAHAHMDTIGGDAQQPSVVLIQILIADWLERIIPQQMSDQGFDLDLREIETNADPWATAEDCQRVGGAAILFAWRSKVVRIKTLRKVALAPMVGADCQQDIRVGRQLIAGEFTGGEHATWHQTNRQVEPPGFENGIAEAA